MEFKISEYFYVIEEFSVCILVFIDIEENIWLLRFGLKGK